MSEKEIPMEELGPTEEARNDPGPDPAATGPTASAEAKANKKVLRPASSSCIPSSTSASSQRRRLTGGASLLRNLTRRGSFGSSLNENFDPSDPNTMEGQKLLLKCPVQLTINSHTRSRYLFLWEDVLICAKQKSPTNFHTKHRIDLHDLWLGADGPESIVNQRASEETTDEVMSSEAGGAMDNCCLTIGWPTVQAMLKFPSSDERDTWRNKLRELMELAREKESPHTIVRIVQNDENYSVTKSMMVNQCETAKMVLARCIKEFHIPNELPSNFQLSVLKSRNDLPIPLTGQEILYRIQMKQNRELDVDKDASAEMELEPGEGLVFQLIPTEKKMGNVLKRTLASEDGKPAKRASSLTRFFRTTFRLHDDGKLFRRNLSELCKDGKLCWRLMMILSHLFVHGPTFEEVFRKPPSIKVHRVLQERLDRSKDFDFDKVNACEMSHLLKTFLNYLPECLLTFELYPKWAEVAQMEDKKEALSHYKSLVDCLPDCNRLLLRHLICVLHRISVNHQINGMPPKSLSICIGQCILFQPHLKPAANEASSDINKALKQLGIANSVTETLIEFAEDVFGVDVLHLFDHLSAEPTTLDTVDAPVKFRNRLQVHGVSDCVNKDPVNGGHIPDILSSTDNCVLGRSYPCLSHSTMSLTDGVKDTDLDRLRECDISLKLNSSWHLSGSGYVSKEYIRPQPEGLSLDSSHSSSQASYLDMFPDTTAESMYEMKHPHMMLSILRNNNVDSSNDSTAKFYMPSADSPVLGESARTTSAADKDLTANDSNGSKTSKFSLEIARKPGILSEDVTKPKFFPEDLKNHKFHLEDINKQSADTKAGNVRIGLNENTQPTRGEELFSSNAHSLSDSESLSSPVFVFPETVNLPSPLSAERFATEYTTSHSSQLQCLSPRLQSPEKSPMFQIQESPTRKVAPLKSKPSDLVIVTPKLRLSAETCVKSPLPSLTLQSPEQTNRNSDGTPTPDDGYSSSLNSAKLHSSVGKTFELLPSRLEKNFQNYGTQSKHDESPTSPRVSGQMQSSSYACLSKPTNRTELGTPTGIVHRLKSEIALREISQQRPSCGPLSPNKEFSKEMLRSSLSQSGKGSISKSKSFSCSESSSLPPRDHSQTVEQDKNDKSCRADRTLSPEMHNSRPTSIPVRSREGCTRDVVSDPGVPGYIDYLKIAEPLSNSQALTRETQRSNTQLDSPRHTPGTDKNNRSIHFEIAAQSRTSPLRASTGESEGRLKTPLVKCTSLPLKSPVIPSPASDKSALAMPMDYQVFDKGTLQSSENTTVARQSSPPRNLYASTAENAPTNGKNLESALDCVVPNELDSPTDDMQKRSTKRRLCNSEPKIVSSNSSQQEIERSRSDTSGIASKTSTEPDEDRLNEANKENLSRYQILKRISEMGQSSTPEKLSKRCKESVDSAAETVDDDTTPKSPDLQKMSVKNRDWHKELLEEYTRPSPSSSSSSQTATKKTSQRLSVLSPKISYTPMPIQAYQGSSSKLLKGTDKSLRKP